MNENINYWLVPNNPAKYDAIKAFKELNVIDWGNGGDNKIEIGDIIYVYSSKPIQAITIKAKVIKIDIDEKNLLNNDKSYNSFNNTDIERKYFRLQLLNFTNIKNLTLDKLKNNGLKSPPQGKQKLKDEILKYIIDNDLNQLGENNNMRSKSLNQILFGPPGTGKTFNTINKALEIIDSDFFQANKDDRTALKAKFKEYKKAGQIEFVTFHQSYGYEEFVEGIKAIPVGKEGNEDGNEMIYDVSNGIFKKLSNKANQDSILFEENDEFDDLYKNYLNNLSLFNDSNRNEKILNTKTGKEFKLYKNSNSIEVYSNTKVGSVSLNLLKRTISDGKAPYYEPYVSVILDDMLKGKSFNITKTSITKNYILIIDEINRGNISKIFGELITLIESSKRIGAQEEIKVKLPYSNDEFGVPQNLYILGTMNTADRSIALMDTALRRRFEFIEMLPDLEALKDIKVEDIEISKLLEKINQRVEYLYDRDHTIGHAYFMSLKDKIKNNDGSLRDKTEDEKLIELESIFKNKIIPLLQEYFYDDWEKIRLVLADNQKEKKDDTNKFQFIKINKDYNISKLFGDNSQELLTDDETIIYEINEEAFKNKESYKKVYEK